MTYLYLSSTILKNRYIGYVDNDGKIYEQLNYPNIGRLIGYTAAYGRIYEQRSYPTPGDYIGDIDNTGRVYRASFGQRPILGRVFSDGRVYRQDDLGAPVGYVEGDNIMMGGAAILLLFSGLLSSASHNVQRQGSYEDYDGWLPSNRNLTSLGREAYTYSLYDADGRIMSDAFILCDDSSSGGFAYIMHGDLLDWLSGDYYRKSSCSPYHSHFFFMLNEKRGIFTDVGRDFMPALTIQPGEWVFLEDYRYHGTITYVTDPHLKHIGYIRDGKAYRYYEDDYSLHLLGSCPDRPEFALALFVIYGFYDFYAKTNDLPPVPNKYCDWSLNDWENKHLLLRSDQSSRVITANSSGQLVFSYASPSYGDSWYFSRADNDAYKMTIRSSSGLYLSVTDQNRVVLSRQCGDHEKFWVQFFDYDESTKVARVALRNAFTYTYLSELNGAICAPYYAPLETEMFRLSFFSY